jgi:quercetin dioxygenase-like cupin family protein
LHGAITPAFREAIPNISSKSLVATMVSHPPGGPTPAHYHRRFAFVAGYVLSGSIRSQEDDGKAQVFRAGEHGIEPPGAHHPISENASTTKPADLLGIVVVDSTDTEGLVTSVRQ